MRLYTIEADGAARVAFEAEGGYREVAAPDLVAYVRGEGRDETGRVFPLDSRVLAPLRPGKIFCSGLNYRSHVTENPGARFLEDPRFFVKLPQCVIGPGEAIEHPGEEFGLDYEVELAVVIGRRMRSVRPEEAMAHVFGYTILHDVSARAVQFKDNNEDMGKNFDTFAPMGPCVVTADEIPDPAALRLTLDLNGERMQDGTNGDWCFPLPRLLAWLSMGITLEPGDVVTTGTPAGIGWFRSPRVFLRPGDVCRLWVEGIGELVNPIVAKRPDYVAWGEISPGTASR